MEHLLSVWPEVVKQLRSAEHILLLTDYDGTLTPIVERPELANLSGGMRQLLRILVRQRHFTLGVISGRALADLREKVAINGIIYAGNYGLEIEGPEISFVNPVAEELRPILNVMCHVLSQALGTIKGAFVENKGLSLGVHYRLAAEGSGREVERIVKQVVGSAGVVGQVMITSGKKVYEVRPAVDWNKGKAIELLVKKYNSGGRKSRLLPIYLGDDQTDEDGFEFIRDSGIGISVFVGEQSQHSTARYFLKSSAEVAAFLGILLEQARKGFK